MTNITKQRKKNSAIFVVAAIITVCFLLGSLMFVYISGQRNEEKSIQYLRDATTQRQAALNQQIESDLQVLRGVAIGLSEIDLSNSERILVLLDRVNRSNSFVRMGLANTDGLIDLVDLDGTIYKNVDLSDMDFFQEAVEGRDSLSGMVSSFTTSLDVNYYAVPVYQSGEIVGVLCAVNTHDVFDDILNTPVFQGDGFFLIVDKEGLVVAPSTGINADVAVGSYILQTLGYSDSKQTDLSKNLASGGSGSYVAKMFGEKVTVTNQTLGYNDWHVLSIVPKAGVTAYYNRTAVGAGVISLVASLLFILLLFWQKHVLTRNQRSLEVLAYTDMLTGVNNQAKFLLDAECLLEERGTKKYAAWSFDINKFNNINDVFGVAVGDRVLQGVASVFENHFPIDSTFCRVSSDLFAGLLSYREKQDISDWCHQVWGDLEQQDVVPANRMRISSAMGFYCIEDYPEEQLDVSNMVSRASTARRQAKKTEMNELHFFTKEISDRLRREAELEAGGRQALQHGDITFFLQPKVNIENGFVITGAEALTRWKHPVHGWVSPAEFIPLFERSRFVVDLDRFIFKQVCKWYTTECKLEGPALKFSINVSRQGLKQIDFIDYYTDMKDYYGIADGILELEFTESAILDDYQLFQYIVDELHKTGFTCSIDDFGSGYSSLNVLKNLTIDVLKLDTLFFKDSVETSREQIVISNSIRMARELGVKTVAEGVETRQQVEFLQHSGCEIVQGYYFSKPLSQTDFERLLNETKGNFGVLC